jgi:DNA-binding transcriptional LysR family regulator
MSAIELRHLRYFVAVAEELHFGRAAERLGLAQPPLSQQIQRLEAMVGHRLLERRPRVRLTAAGEALLASSRAALAQADDAVHAARRAGQGLGGVLTVGFPASALLTAVPPLVRRFRQRYPAVELRLRELSTAEQIEALRSGAIDLGFLRETRDAPDLTTELVLREPFVAVLPGEHPLTAEPALNLAQLSQEPFVLFPQRVAPGLHAQVFELCRRAGFTPQTVQVAQEWLTIVGLVDAGVGVSLVPASFERLRWGDVQYRPLNDADVETTLSLARAPGAGHPACNNFVAIAREAVTSS